MHNGARGMERKTTEFISETEIHVNWPTKECISLQYIVTVEKLKSKRFSLRY